MYLPDPRGAGLDLAFQFSYVWTDQLMDGWMDGVSFVSLIQILVPTDSLREYGQRDKKRT